LTESASPTASIDRSGAGLQGDELDLDEDDDDNDPGGGDDNDDFGDEDNNDDDAGFGDDFDDFEEGQEGEVDDDDFGEFDEGFQTSQPSSQQAPSTQQQPPQPSSQPTIVSTHYDMHDNISCSNEQTAIEMIYLTDAPEVSISIVFCSLLSPVSIICYTSLCCKNLNTTFSVCPT
jgi:hypothetical protein